MPPALTELASRLAGLFRRRRIEDDLERELASHVAMAAEANERRGMTPEEARRQALIALGGVEQAKEGCREERGLPFAESVFRDFRFGFRILRRSPGFSALTVLCLTLGIGANAVVFSWVEGILFRPFAGVVRQDRLFALVGTIRGESRYDDVSWPDFLDLRRSSSLADSFIADKIMGTTLSIGTRAERVTGSIVSANYFDALGVRPILGRGFLPGDETGKNAHPVVVIGYRTWKERFGADPQIIGKIQRLDGVPHTIVGVAPEGFAGTFVGYAMQVWVPASMVGTFAAGTETLEDRSARWIEGFVRLKPGVTLEKARSEISAVARQLEASYPTTNRGRGLALLPLRLTPFNKAGELRPTLGILIVVVAFVLLIVCANVVNLLLARSFARRQEMTVRLALGAGRRRLVRQLLAEGVILAALAGVGAALLVQASRHVLESFFPARGGIPVNLTAAIDGRVLLAGGAICLISTLVAALIPAFQNTRIELAGVLKSEVGGVVGQRESARGRSALVLVQISLSFVLLIGAGLVLRSLRAMRDTSPGFSTRDVLVTAINLSGAGYDAARAKSYQARLLDRVRAIPGVRTASLSRVVPLGVLPFSTASIAVAGFVPPIGQQPTASYNEVGTEYFATTGVSLASGREFTSGDDETSARVAIVNETMARKYWGNRDPIGEILEANGRPLRVVGVARTAKYQSVKEEPMPFFYVPFRQNFTDYACLNIRTRLDPPTIAAALAGAVRSLDPNVAPREVISMQQQIERSTSAQRVAVSLLEVFSGLAVLLSMIGLYGVMAYAVSQRKRELGLRMALGASAADLLRLVMLRGIALTLGGIGVGAIASIFLAGPVSGLLYRVRPRDPAAFALAIVVMGAASLAACVLPAWRATRADPIRALRG